MVSCRPGQTPVVLDEAVVHRLIGTPAIMHDVLIQRGRGGTAA
jgi:hypothetical protein